MSHLKRIKLEDEDQIEGRYEEVGYDFGTTTTTTTTEDGGVEKIVCGNEEFLVMPVKCEMDDDGGDFYSEGYEINDENITTSGVLSASGEQFYNSEDPNFSSIRNEANTGDGTDDKGNFEDHDVLTVLPEVFLEKEMIGKNGYIWKTSTKPSGNNNNNILGKQIPTVVPSLCSLQRPEDIFRVYFPPQMISAIVTNTNAYIRQIQTHSADCDCTDEDEITALIGLLVLTGALNMNHVSVTDMFDPIFSGNIFKCTFTQDRFQFLQNSLRFGNQRQIERIKGNDQFAEMRFTWEHFITMCRQSFQPGSAVTIGEHMLPFSGQCPFKKANPGGTDYIKLMVICDTQTKYMFDAFPHMGKGTKNMTQVKEWINTLTRSIYGSKRNVTVDSWPVTLKTASELYAPPVKLTIVGTTSQNQPSIPPPVHHFKKNKVATSTICRDDDKILLSYNVSQNDLTLLVSTLHQDTVVGETDSNKQPELLKFYNENKAAIEVFDQMCKRYSCSRISGLWPLAVFHGMINIAGVNSYIIYRYNMQRSHHRLLGKRDFMKRIAQELVKPFLRKKQSSIGSQVEESMQTILTDFDYDRDEVELWSSEDQSTEKRTICRICPARRRRMTVSSCKKCRRPYCREHRSSCCSECGC